MVRLLGSPSPSLSLSSSCSADKLRKFRQKVGGETKNKIIEKLTQFFGAQ